MNYVREWEVEWCKGFFALLSDGGVWGVPRSGLLFTRQGDALNLTERMPWQVTMPINPEELREYQDEDFEQIKKRFDEAGIPMEDKTSG